MRKRSERAGKRLTQVEGATREGVTSGEENEEEETLEEGVEVDANDGRDCD